MGYIQYQKKGRLRRPFSFRKWLPVLQSYNTEQRFVNQIDRNRPSVRLPGSVEAALPRYTEML